MSNLTLPTVHLNGSSQENLLDGYIAAMDALREAVKALQATSPNGRDYYTQGPDALPKAVKEHSARLHRLADTIHELNAIAEHISGLTP